MKALIAGAVLIAAVSSPASAQVAIAGRVADNPAAAGVPSKPAPRLPDGHPDLGNGKGSWNPRVIANIAGVGDPNRSPVERIIDVPFQSWAKGVYDERQRNLQQQDPESKCLPPGIPRMMATPF